ncbi:MAG: type II toxin-antitoxin system VapC family toxin [Thermoproteota archaeon]|jgi:predicted nucleic acid-binding protein
MSYVDTSVIVAALDQLDSRQKLAQEVLEKEENKKISELVLTELASILSRKESMLLELSKKIKVREELIMPVVILYIMKRFKLSYKKVNGYKRILVIGNLYSPLGTAIEISSKFKLKTLDLLHLAYIRALIDQGEEISRLITADEDFEKEKEHISQELNVKVKTLTVDSYS